MTRPIPAPLTPEDVFNICMSLNQEATRAELLAARLREVSARVLAGVRVQKSAKG